MDKELLLERRYLLSRPYTALYRLKIIGTIVRRTWYIHVECTKEDLDTLGVSIKSCNATGEEQKDRWMQRSTDRERWQERKHTFQDYEDQVLENWKQERRLSPDSGMRTPWLGSKKGGIGKDEFMKHGMLPLEI